MATVSMNGWTLTGFTRSTISAGGRSTEVRSGPVATILGYVGQRFHAEVEALQTFHGWRSVALNAQIGGHPRSNHPSGTAIDCNGSRHPRYRSGTFTTGQVAAIRRILADCEGVVRWGGDFGAAMVDEMHFEIVGNAAQVAALAARLTSQVSNPGTSIPTAPTIPTPTPNLPTPIEEDDMPYTPEELRAISKAAARDAVVEVLRAEEFQLTKRTRDTELDAFHTTLRASMLEQANKSVRPVVDYVQRVVRKLGA